jgi:hypothetical protein
MLRECFSNPIILAIFSTDDNNETVSCGVIGMEKVGDDFEEAEATGKNNEEIFGAEEMVQILLELLALWLDWV